MVGCAANNVDPTTKNTDKNVDNKVSTISLFLISLSTLALSANIEPKTNTQIKISKNKLFIINC